MADGDEQLAALAARELQINNYTLLAWLLSYSDRLRAITVVWCPF